MSLTVRECPINCHEVSLGVGREGLRPVAQRQEPDPAEEVEHAIEVRAPETRPVIEIANEALGDDAENDSEVAKAMDNEKEPEKFKDAVAAKKK